MSHNERPIRRIPRLGETVETQPITPNKIHLIGSKKDLGPTQTSHSVLVDNKQQINKIGVTNNTSSFILENSSDVIMKSIRILEDLRPTLCDHLYNTLFVNPKLKPADNVLNNDTDKNNPLERVRQIDYKKYFEEYVNVLKLETVLALFKFSSSPDRYIAYFVSDEGVKHMYNQSRDLETNYDISKRENINTIVNISKQNFLDLSLETYPNDESLIRQFLMDIPRQDVYVNKVKVSNIDQLLLAIGSFNREIRISTKNRQTISSTMLAIAMICQSSFFLSFLHLHSKCTKMRSVLDEKNIDPNDARRNFHVSDYSDRSRISINITQNSLQCSFLSKYKIVDIATEQIVYIVKTEILVDVDNDCGLIVYETL